MSFRPGFRVGFGGASNASNTSGGGVNAPTVAGLSPGVFANPTNKQDYDFDRLLIELEYAMKYWDTHNDSKSFRLLRSLYLSVQPWRKVHDVRTNASHEWQVTFDDQYSFRRKSYLSGVGLKEQDIAIYPDDRDKSNNVIISRGTASTGLTKQEWIDEGGAEPGQQWKNEAYDRFDGYTCLRIPYGIVGFEGLIDRYGKLYNASVQTQKSFQSFQDHSLTKLQSRTNDAVIKCRLLTERNARLRKRVLEVSDKVDRFFKEIPETNEERQFRNELNKLQTQIKGIDIKTKITSMEQQLQLRLDEKEIVQQQQHYSVSIPPTTAKPLSTKLDDKDQHILFNKLKDIHQGVVSLITELKKRDRHTDIAKTILNDMTEHMKYDDGNNHHNTNGTGTHRNSRNNLQMMMMEESLD